MDQSPRLEKLPRKQVPKIRHSKLRWTNGKRDSKHPWTCAAGVPLYVGEPSRKSQIGKDDVRKFAQAIFEEKRTEFGVMLGWNFDMEARRAAEILKARENKRIDFVRLQLVRLEDKEFRDTSPTNTRTTRTYLPSSSLRRCVLKGRDRTNEVSIRRHRVGKPEPGRKARERPVGFRLRRAGSHSTPGFAFLREKDGEPLLAVGIRIRLNRQKTNSLLGAGQPRR